MQPTDDPVKRRILVELQADGRLTNQELAERVGVSPSPCWRRVKELEDQGVIRRYAALLDPEKAGMPECVFTLINLEMHNREFARGLRAGGQGPARDHGVLRDHRRRRLHPEIQVPNIRAYNRLLNEVVFRIPGVKHVKSSFTLREVKYDTALPLPEGQG